MCLAGLLAGCGGSDSGVTDTSARAGTPTPAPTPTSSVNSTSALTVTGGRAFAPASFLGVVAQGYTCSAQSASFVGIAATSDARTCATALQNRANTSTLVVYVIRTRSNGKPASAVGPGTYRIASLAADPEEDAPVAYVAIGRSDGSCGVDLTALSDAFATSGTVVLTSVTDRVEGTVNATLDGGGTVTGAFSAPVCANVGGDALCGGMTAGQSSGACVP